MAKWGRTADTVHAVALASHVACCGAPLVLNGLALAFGAGLLTAASPWMEATHGALHGREGLLLSISAGLVALGGLTQYLSWRADCGRNRCHHEPCAPKKPRRIVVFGLVCALFLGNVVLFAWHQDGRDNVAAGLSNPAGASLASPA
jgi:hypothetical protein